MAPFSNGYKSLEWELILSISNAEISVSIMKKEEAYLESAQMFIMVIHHLCSFIRVQGHLHQRNPSGCKCSMMECVA